MSANDEYILSEHNKEMIKYFRQRAESNAYSLIDANGLEFIEESRDEIYYRLTALVHFGSFDMSVYYYSAIFPETEYSDYIDFSLKFPSSEYKFSIYDIFNYLDIEDFNLYYYNHSDVKSSVDSAVDNIFAVCQKYMADIDYIAKRSDAVAKLEKQCDADEYITDDSESDDYTAEDEDMIDDFEAITVLRPVCYRGSQQSIIKKLIKKEEKDLITLYERRFLEYLEAGNAMPSESENGKKKINKKYLKAELCTHAVIVVLSLVFAYVLAIIAQKFILGDAYVSNDVFVDFKLLGLFSEQFLKALVSGLFFYIAFAFLLGGKIISLFAPDEDKKSFSLKYTSEGLGIIMKSKLVKIFLILLILAGILILALPISIF